MKKPTNLYLVIAENCAYSVTSCKFSLVTKFSNFQATFPLIPQVFGIITPSSPQKSEKYDYLKLLVPKSDCGFKKIGMM